MNLYSNCTTEINTVSSVQATGVVSIGEIGHPVSPDYICIITRTKDLSMCVYLYQNTK